MYLSGLQFMAQHPLRRPCWRRLYREEEIDCIEEELAGPWGAPQYPDAPYHLNLTWNHTKLYCGRSAAYFTGVLLLLLPEWNQAGNGLNQISHEAFRRLQAEIQKSLHVFCPCACHALELVRDSMVVWGLSEAALFVTHSGDG